ncbi:DUF3857 domain-containing protein [Flavobacterium sp.]|uniref:DUF3857 domain-containing protein n=1 Tax=Flavobacterium sp. TaxID=239 RepID=UPI00262E3341|nr:DUF3857 domain-containing protein [Flavobacterium sp.]
MNWLTSLSKVLFFLFLLGFNSSYSQKTFEEYKSLYPDSNEIVIKDYQSYSISIEGKKLKILSSNEFESQILTDIGINNNEESFSYSDLITLIDYKAFTKNTIKGKDKIINVTQSNEKKDNSGSIFHDDIKLRQLIFPNLEVGSKKNYSYQREFTDPFLLHRFIFGNGFPTENATLEVILDKNINIGYSVFNDPNNKIEFNQFERKGKKVYQWSLKNINAFKFEDNTLGVLYDLPNINVYIKDYTIDNKTISVLGNIERLYAYYKNFINQINKTEDEELKNLAIEITKNEKTEIEKVKKIFYWVKDNINYIAFEEAYAGFIPRESSLVFQRKFGDCKDMAALINSMAKYANVNNVHICWIGTRSIPYTYAELSTPSVDNHMIAVYDNKGEYIFLDATDKQTKFGIPTDFIQDKEALVSYGDTFKIIKVPVVSAQDNLVDEVINVSIDNDKLLGSGSMFFNGYNRTEMLYNLKDSKDKLRFDIIKGIVIKGNNKFNLKDYKEQNILDKDKSYIIDFNFEIPNYIINVDNEIYVNLFLDQNITQLSLNDDRKSNYDLKYLTKSAAKYILQVPKNYKLKHLPSNFSLSNDLVDVNFKFESKNDTVHLDATFTLKKMTLQVTDFKLWNESLYKIKEAYSETIILEKK